MFMWQNYLGSAVLGFAVSMAITLIWSRFKGLPTIMTWTAGAILGAVAWWVHGKFGGALEVVLSLLLAGVFMAVIDWHGRVVPA
jgi:hypothetical protein